MDSLPLCDLITVLCRISHYGTWTWRRCALCVAHCQTSGATSAYSSIGRTYVSAQLIDAVRQSHVGSHLAQSLDEKIELGAKSGEQKKPAPPPPADKDKSAKACVLAPTHAAHHIHTRTHARTHTALTLRLTRCSR